LATPARRHSTIAAGTREKNSSAALALESRFRLTVLPGKTDSEQRQSQIILITARTVDHEQGAACLIRDQFDSTRHDEVTLEIRNLPGRNPRTRFDQLQQLLAGKQAQVAPHGALAGVAAGILERSAVGLVANRDQDQVNSLL